jgi:hypothetical protein
LKLALYLVAQRRCRLDRLEGGDEHRSKTFAILEVDLLEPVEVPEVWNCGYKVGAWQ